jgi:drug/metabolite transporter (DMT)-like permease
MLVTASRFALATLVVAPWLVLVLARSGSRTIARGVALGALLAAGFCLQAVGLTTIESGRSAFLTSSYVLFTPLLEWMVTGRRPAARSILGAALAVSGIAVMAAGPLPLAGLARGDLLTLLAALAFAAQIVLIHRALQRDRARPLLVLQIASCAIFCSFFLPIAEPLRLRPTFGLAWSIVFLGVVATALVLGLQTWGQRRVSPTTAALLFSSEPLWAALLALAIGERMSQSEVAGGALVLVGVLAGTWPARPVQRGQRLRSSISPR